MPRHKIHRKRLEYKQYADFFVYKESISFAHLRTF
ncbi:hypothetical protein HOQ51_gp36 [uncultured phage_MedDCM-OCT-S35-C6]|nr:hypothetical protein HOQ51_gp36 [uncultured phage_MedDCM-OCT-S35-C6]